jgi:hypothetical protein
MRPEYQRSQGLMSPPVANAAGWNHHACPGLRPDFLQWLAYTDMRIGSTFANLPPIPSLFGDPLAFQRHTALYLSRGRVRASQAPPLCHQPEVPHRRRATGQLSGFDNPLDCH